MGDALRSNRILQRASDMLLAGNILEALRPPFPRQYQVRHKFRPAGGQNYGGRFSNYPPRCVDSPSGCPLLTARFPRGTGVCRYRCFLPDLTGFAVPPCTGPNYQQSTSRSETRPNIAPALTTYWVSQTYFLAAAGNANWRRGRDSNPRCGVNRTHDFQSCTFNRSVTSPIERVNHDYCRWIRN